MLINPTIGPGGPAWPGGPFKPCSPWEKTEDKKGDTPSFFKILFLFYGLLSLTAGPGMPLRPWGPDFPGCPWGPTGPVFPMSPSKPGAPWNQMAPNVTIGSCDSSEWAIFLSHLCSFQTFFSSLAWFSQVTLKDTKNREVAEKMYLTQTLNRKWGFRSRGRHEDKKDTNPSSRRSRWSRFSSCSWKSLKKQQRSITVNN